MKSLESHCRVAFRDSLTLFSTPGDKILYAVADSPFRFNLAAFPGADAIEGAVFRFEHDRPSRPILSGSSEFAAGGETVLALTPLMCRIVLESVTNGMDGYKRLEDPRAFLSQVNAEAELFRVSGFSPSEQQPDTLRTLLPCDIGLFTQYPGTVLYCYPNDPGEFSAPSPATVLNLEGECDGRTRLMSFPLPGMGRGCELYCSVDFDETRSSVCYR